jgi:hypothetical protein
MCSTFKVLFPWKPHDSAAPLTRCFSVIVVLSVELIQVKLLAFCLFCSGWFQHMQTDNEVTDTDNELQSGDPFPNTSFPNPANADLYAVEKEVSCLTL